MELIEDSIEIRATPEEVFAFFVGMGEEEYRAWHPNHVTFRWVRGKPLEQGSIGYFEEYIHGQLHRMEVRYTKSGPEQGNRIPHHPSFVAHLLSEEHHDHNPS